MANQTPSCQIANHRNIFITRIEEWAKPHALSMHRQDDSVSLCLSERRHLFLLAPSQSEAISVFFIGQFDPSHTDARFPDRFVTWLREGGNDQIPDAVYVHHLHGFGYGITIPLADWPSIETQYLPIIDFFFAHLSQLVSCYQAVSGLDLEGDEARAVRDRFHLDAFIRFEFLRMSRIPMGFALAMQ